MGVTVTLTVGTHMGAMGVMEGMVGILRAAKRVGTRGARLMGPDTGTSMRTHTRTRMGMKDVETRRRR